MTAIAKVSIPVQLSPCTWHQKPDEASVVPTDLPAGTLYKVPDRVSWSR